MRKQQAGEVVLAMMAVMLVLMMLGGMYMGKMDDGNAHAEKPENAKQQTKAVATPSTTSKESAEPQN